MKKFIISLISSFFILLLSACSNSPNSPKKDYPNIVATTNVYGNIAHMLAGEHLQVYSIINDSNQDPHEYKASGKDQLFIANASLVIENGGGYDDFGDQMIKNSNNPNVRLIKVEDFAPKNDNEHYWYDMPTIIKLIDKITVEIQKIDPLHSEDYFNNADILKKKIDNIENREISLKNKNHNQSVLITEQVPLYMLEAAGFKDITSEELNKYIESGDEIPVAIFVKTEEQIKSNKVNLLAYNEQTLDNQSKKIKKIIENNKIPSISFSETIPEKLNFVNWMEGNIENLEEIILD